MGGETCKKDDPVGDTLALLTPPMREPQVSREPWLGRQFRVARTAAGLDRPPAQKPTPEDRAKFLDTAKQMSPEKLFDQVVLWRDDPGLLGSVIAQRPDSAPELVRQAIARGDQESAKWIAKQMNDRFVAALGEGPEAERMYLAALELEGDGSDAVRRAMRNMVRQRDARYEQFREDSSHGLNNGVSDGTGGSYADDKGLVLDRALKDPGSGRLYARYLDDPAAAAAQLHDEALHDPKAFKRHAGSLSDLLWNSPAQAAALTKEILALDGKDSVNVKEWLAAELHQAMAPAMGQMNEGIGAVPEHHRFATLMPLLAEVVADPEVVINLDPARNSADRLMPPHLGTMKHLLADVLSPSYARNGDVDGTEVRDKLNQGGARLLDMSMAAEAPKERRFLGEAGGRFVGELTTAEASAKETSFSTALGEILSGMTKYLPIPGPYKAAGRGAAAILQAIGNDEPARNWAPDAIDALLRQSYESRHPRPDGADDSDEVREHEENFVDWRKDARDAYVARLVINHGG